MQLLDLRNRRFVGVDNYDDGDARRDTVFNYDQSGDIVTATYSGGRIRHGQILARVTQDNSLEMTWQYLNVDGILIAGTCRSVPELLPDGRYRLHESWTVTVGPNQDESGTSVIEEIR
ncbi:MAG: n-acetylglutamate synthase [Candidatus Zixiibacteriota bacterium]